jgi:hypothetical protein
MQPPLASTDVNLGSTSQLATDRKPLKPACDTQKSSVLLIVLSKYSSRLNRETESAIATCIIVAIVLNPSWLDDSEGNQEWAFIWLPSLSWIGSNPV